MFALTNRSRSWPASTFYLHALITWLVEHTKFGFFGHCAVVLTASCPRLTDIPCSAIRPKALGPKPERSRFEELLRDDGIPYRRCCGRAARQTLQSLMNFSVYFASAEWPRRLSLTDARTVLQATEQKPWPQE